MTLQFKFSLIILCAEMILLSVFNFIYWMLLKSTKFKLELNKLTMRQESILFVLAIIINTVTIITLDTTSYKYGNIALTCLMLLLIFMESRTLKGLRKKYRY